MKLGNSKSNFTILLTEEERTMFGSTELVAEFKVDSVDKFLTLYQVGHPHARGERVSILAYTNGGTTSPYRILMSKSGTSKSNKWRFLNQLPNFSPESVSIDSGNADGRWTISRPAMERVAPQAEAKARKQEDVPAVAYVERPALPKPAAQIMTREEFSDTAMYKSRKDGMALVNKAMAFYGGRLVIEQRDGRLIALLEVTGD